MTKEQIIAAFKSYAEGLIEKNATSTSGGGLGGMLGKVAGLAGNANGIEQQIKSKITEYTSQYNIPGLNEELSQVAASYIKQYAQKLGL